MNNLDSICSPLKYTNNLQTYLFLGEKTNKLYTDVDKWDYMKIFKDIIEVTMVSTANSLIGVDMSGITKKIPQENQLVNLLTYLTSNRKLF